MMPTTVVDGLFLVFMHFVLFPVVDANHPETSAHSFYISLRLGR
jgi:hypothetical protein